MWFGMRGHEVGEFVVLSFFELFSRRGFCWSSGSEVWVWVWVSAQV